MNIKAAIVCMICCALCFSSCWHHDNTECENGGEVIEGTCICPDGYSGLYCEYFLPTASAGTYQLDNAVCDSLPIAWTQMQLKSSLVSELAILMTCDQLLRPVTVMVSPGYYDGFYEGGSIPLQDNFILDSLGGQTPIQLQGVLMLDITRGWALFDFKHPSCFVKFVRQ